MNGFVQIPYILLASALEYLEEYKTLWMKNTIVEPSYLSVFFFFFLFLDNSCQDSCYASTLQSHDL